MATRTAWALYLGRTALWGLGYGAGLGAAGRVAYLLARTGADLCLVAASTVVIAMALCAWRAARALAARHRRFVGR